MPLPLLTSPDRPHAWARGAYLPLPTKEWRIEGFPGFSVDEAGTVWREAYTTRGGIHRPRLALRSRSLAGTSHYRLFRNGFPVCISQRKLKALLRRA